MTWASRVLTWDLREVTSVAVAMLEAFSPAFSAFSAATFFLMLAAADSPLSVP